MPDINDVYRKFGEVAEAAQLLESRLGDWLLWEKFLRDDLSFDSDQILTPKIFQEVDRLTIGQLLDQLKKHSHPLKNFEADLRKALDERNILFHSFYLDHNIRRNSSEGCQIMLEDLEELHETILDAYYKAIAVVWYRSAISEPIVTYRTLGILSTAKRPKYDNNRRDSAVNKLNARSTETHGVI